MLIKVKGSWKDLVDKPDHKGLTRRDFLMRGMATGAMTLAVNNLLLGDIVKKALADTLACPAPVRNMGAIAQIFSDGGPTMGARFISEQQATMAASSTGMASNYGITGQNFVKLGPNLVVDSTSPFGFTLLQGPPGYPGGATAWQANMIGKVSGGGHLGPFNADDGAGENTGLLGGVSPFKASQMGKDIKIGTSATPALWAQGLPSSTVSKNNLSPTSLANVFSLVPSSNGLTSATAMSQASATAGALAGALEPVLKNASRRNADKLSTNVGCAFYGNSALADPNYGSSLFNPNNISALSGRLTVSSLTNSEQAQLAGFYQSASGVAGGMILQFNGRDYHGADPQNTIAPADIEEARSIVMFLAACEAAGAPGAMIYLSNGQAIANSTRAVTANINGQTANLNAPVASGDAGGSYNAGLILFYDPKGSPPSAKFTGTVNSSNGSVKTDANVASSNEAVAGLYLSALKWVGNGQVPPDAITKMQAAGVAATFTKAMVL